MNILDKSLTRRDPADSISAMKTVAVTGAGGFVGRRLVSELLARGYRVVALGRTPATMSLPAAVERRRFDPNDPQPDPAVFADVDGVVHLAGESVAGRWNAEKKRAIRDSRVLGTRHLIEALAACERKPEVFVCASASGYYASRGDEALTEVSAPGDDFLAQVCQEWEHEARGAERLGMRTVMLRTGIVLGRDGGALAQMALPFRFGAGGPFGSGRQFMPWIHLVDLTAMYVAALEREDLRGPINAVAPDYATSTRVAQAIGHALNRPALLPAPAFGLRLALGEFAESIIGSQLILPTVAEDAGFVWTFPLLERAMNEALASDRRIAVRTATAVQTMPGSLEAVYAQTIPPAYRSRGEVYTEASSLGGKPATMLIARAVPNRELVRVQLHGPLTWWRCAQRFEPNGGEVRVTQELSYLGPADAERAVESYLGQGSAQH
jgi:uncharacterized protein (TIGR01777 family)